MAKQSGTFDSGRPVGGFIIYTDDKGIKTDDLPATRRVRQPNGSTDLLLSNAGFIPARIVFNFVRQLTIGMLFVINEDEKSRLEIWLNPKGSGQWLTPEAMLAVDQRLHDKEFGVKAVFGSVNGAVNFIMSPYSTSHGRRAAIRFAIRNGTLVAFLPSAIPLIKPT